MRFYPDKPNRVLAIRDPVHAARSPVQRVLKDRVGGRMKRAAAALKVAEKPVGKAGQVRELVTV